jgi:hypothetical protein
MPWASKQKSKNAVRGCFGAAGKNGKKRAKCRKMAHEARVWRGGKRVKKRGRKRARSHR